MANDVFAVSAGAAATEPTTAIAAADLLDALHLVPIAPKSDSGRPHNFNGPLGRFVGGRREPALRSPLSGVVRENL